MTQEVNPMPYFRAVHSAPNNASTVFQTRTAVFELPVEATFEYLADCLCRLGERHDGALTGVETDTAIVSEIWDARMAAKRHLFGIHDAPSRSRG
jgi:hypothetical protein